ncbi:MAG: ATP-binding cassette domain-containing protein [Clostridium sp.]|nr:ATP-binding cassette domain-containing protein [Clostridium sp.]
MISQITLDNLLPEAFADGGTDPGSRIWLAGGVTFKRGRLYILEAESGRGKSSLCAFIAGDRADYRGRILFDGTDIRRFAPARWTTLRRDSIAWLAQDPGLFGDLTVMENILIKNSLTGFRSDRWIADALSRLEIDAVADRPASRISIGQQQRAALVRSLCQPFDFLLLDEPVSHLDGRRAAAVAELVMEAAASQGAAVIATSVGVPIPLGGDIIHLKL